MWLLFVCQLLSVSADQALRHGLRLDLVASLSPDHSTPQLALLTVLAELPPLLLSPLLGAVVDAVPQRALLVVLADVVSALAAYVAQQLALPLTVWHQALLAAVMGCCAALQWPAFVLLHRDLQPHLSASARTGLIEAAPALSMLIAPWLATALLDVAGLTGIFNWVFATCAVSSAILLTYTTVFRSPSAASPDKTPTASQSTEPALPTWSSITFKARSGLSLILRSDSLRRLFTLTTIGYLVSPGLVQVAMVPLVLAVGDKHDLAWVLTLSGSGAVVGSGILYFFPSIARAATGATALRAIYSIQGGLLMGCAVAQSAWQIAVIAFLYMLLLPALRGARQSCLERLAPPENLGLLVAVQKGLFQASLSLGAALAGIITRGLETVNLLHFKSLLSAPAVSLMLLGAGLISMASPFLLLNRRFFEPVRPHSQ